MFISLTIRSAVVLPMLSTLLVALVSAGAMTAQAATVLSSVHYQKRIAVVCGDGNYCEGLLAPPGDKRRLNITRMNCALFAPPGSEFAQGGMYLRNPTGINAVVFQYLPVDYSSSNGAHTLNQAVDMQVAATQRVTLFFGIVSGGFFGGGGGECTATGTLDTLQ